MHRAHARGIRILALTDHDTLKGIPEARATCNELGMHLVNGIELSCSWGSTTIHVLGYDFDLHNFELDALVRQLHDSRWLRARKIADRLAGKGMNNALEGACALLEGPGQDEQPPGRPHFAEYLVRSGLVRDHGEAFRKWLGAGKIGDVRQFWPPMEEIMQTLKATGAWISLAHPYHYNLTRSKRRRLVREFVELGGHALEVSNGLQPPEQVGTLAVMAREFGLEITAGSDFHAPHKWSEIGLYRAPAEDLAPLWQRFTIPASQLEPAFGV